MNNKGFTLIQMSLLLIALGAVLIFVFKSPFLKFEDKRASKYKEHGADRVMNEVRRYIKQNKVVPAFVQESVGGNNHMFMETNAAQKIFTSTADRKKMQYISAFSGLEGEICDRVGSIDADSAGVPRISMKVNYCSNQLDGSVFSQPSGSRCGVGSGGTSSPETYNVGIDHDLAFVIIDPGEDGIYSTKIERPTDVYVYQGFHTIDNYNVYPGVNRDVRMLSDDVVRYLTINEVIELADCKNEIVTPKPLGKRFSTHINEVAEGSHAGTNQIYRQDPVSSNIYSVGYIPIEIPSYYKLYSYSNKIRCCLMVVDKYGSPVDIFPIDHIYSNCSPEGADTITDTNGVVLGVVSRTCSYNTADTWRVLDKDDAKVGFAINYKWIPTGTPLLPIENDYRILLYILTEKVPGESIENTHSLYYMHSAFKHNIN